MTAREPESETAESAEEGRFARTSAVVASAAAAGLVLMGWVMRRVGGLYPVELPEHPYWDRTLAHAPLLYVLLPFAFAGTVVMLLAPGALLVIGAARRTSFADAVTRGFIVSFALVAVLGLIVARWFTNPGLPFGIGLITASGAAWIWCAQRGGAILAPSEAMRRLAWLVGLPAFAVVALLPVVFWQDLNPDGAEMLSMARSLDHSLIPRLPTGDLAGLGLGMVAAAYPPHVFYLLGGLTESTARLPILLYLPVLFLAAVGAVEARGDRRLRAPDEALLALGVGAVLVALAYNATYHAYSADVASPAAIDVFAAVCLLGMLKAFAEQARGWFFAFAALGYFTRPIALLVCGLLVAAHLILDRPNWRRSVPTLLTGIGLCIVLAVTYEKGIASWLGLRVDEPSTGVGGRRLRYLLFADWRRLACVVVPGGIVPVVSLVLFPLQDRVARQWSVVALLFLACFWFPAFSALHHYLPATLLALVVFWRVVAGRKRLALWRTVALGAGLIALGLSLPRSFAVDRSSRAIGSQIDFRVGDYLGGPAGFREAFAAKPLLEALFPGYQVRDPDRVFMGAPLVFIHYAAMRLDPRAGPNYLALPPGEAAAEPWFRVAQDDSGSVWVRDRAQWQHQLTHPPPTDFRSPVLALPRESLLPVWGVPAKRYDIDLKGTLDAWMGRTPRE